MSKNFRKKHIIKAWSLKTILQEKKFSLIINILRQFEIKSLKVNSLALFKSYI